MSDVSPDDLTARLRSAAWYRRANGDDRLLAEAADCIDALSADVARLTAERRSLIDGAHQHMRERDDARALVAERDATIERQRRAVQEHRHRVRASDDRYTRAICFDLWRSVLAETAPTPEVPDV